jgi:hypothetical protein
MPVLAAALLCLVVGISDGDTLTVRCEAKADQPALSLLSIRDPLGRA